MSERVCSQVDNAKDDCLTRIDLALRRRDAIALQKKGRRLTFAVTAAALGPIAVLLLGLHVAFEEQIPYVGKTLIFLELLALTFALAIPFLRLEHTHHQWLSERLRAELLRREKFLFLARVGPYLGISDSTIAIRVDQRLAALDNDINDAFAVLALDDSWSWRKSFEDTRHKASADGMPPISAILETYLQERIVAQRIWYSLKALQHERHAFWLEGASKMTLTFALIVAAVHLGMDRQTTGHIDPIKFLTMGALVLPALGAAFIGLLSIFGCRRLSRSYTYHAHALEGLEDSARTLQAEVVMTSLPSDEVLFQFRRILLETEEVLANELRLWWLYMHPESPRAAA